MSEGWQQNLYVKSSPIDGMGVFARRAFATGETIMVREERPVTPEQPLDAENEEFEHHCDWLEGNQQVYLGFPERFLNHSCDHNAFVRFENGASEVIALRPIRRGEEITDHYSVNLWQGVQWQCNCGSERCLGEVPGNFFDLPLEVKLELQPLLSEWFTKEHTQQYQAFLKEVGLD